jgi:hypothetical protein
VNAADEWADGLEHHLGGHRLVAEGSSALVSVDGERCHDPAGV